MRSGQQKQRGRGRNNSGNNNRKGGNPLSRSYDSTGPDVKVRGTAQHVAEKYATLARDAQSVGDNVIAENYLQHAEHYNRIIAAAQAQMQERHQRNEREGNDRDGGDDEDGQVRVRPNGRDGEPERDEDRNQQHGDGQDSRQINGQNHERGRRDEHGDGEGGRERRQRAHNGRQPASDDDAASANGLGPQPTIEGAPAEVSMEDEAADESGGRAATRRPTASARSRRTRKGESGSGEDGGSKEPATAAVGDA